MPGLRPISSFDLTDPASYGAPPLECDLVMKGGITEDQCQKSETQSVPPRSASRVVSLTILNRYPRAARAT